MTNPGEAAPSAGPASIVSPAASADALACAPSGASDDREARRAALRDLAAMIGVEVFY